MAGRSAWDWNVTYGGNKCLWQRYLLCRPLYICYGWTNRFSSLSNQVRLWYNKMTTIQRIKPFDVGTSMTFSSVPNSWYTLNCFAPLYIAKHLRGEKFSLHLSSIQPFYIPLCLFDLSASQVCWHGDLYFQVIFLNFFHLKIALAFVSLQHSDKWNHYLKKKKKKTLKPVMTVDYSWVIWIV